MPYSKIGNIYQGGFKNSLIAKFFTEVQATKQH